MGRKTGTQITGLDQKKETFNHNRMKKQEFKQNEERLKTLWDNLKFSNNLVIGVLEGEKEDQKLKSYLKN